MTPFLAGASRWLFMLHAVLGFTSVGAATHLATYSIGLWRGVEPWRWRTRLFGLLVPLIVLAQYSLGLLIYPAYRVTVRLAWLDKKAPLAAALFDVKEHAAALALPLLAGAALLARLPAAKSTRAVGAWLAIAGALLVWSVALLGLYVASYRPLGGIP